VLPGRCMRRAAANGGRIGALPGTNSNDDGEGGEVADCDNDAADDDADDDGG
jgi:hypothetical protein